METRKESEAMDIALHEQQEDKLSLVTGGDIGQEPLFIDLFIPTPEEPTNGSLAAHSLK